MNKSIVFLLFLGLLGCSGKGILPHEYSALSSPQETFEFAQKAVAYDDPEAFYHCLAEDTKRRIPLSDLKLGWSLAGSFFFMILEAKVKNVLIPAPEPIFRGNLATAKMVLQSHEVEANFLLHREGGKWRLYYPSPYKLPDINKIKRKERTPWRLETYAHYRVDPQEWTMPPKSPQKRKTYPPSVRKPDWRNP